MSPTLRITLHRLLSTLRVTAFSTLSQMRLYAIDNFLSTPTVVLQDAAIPAFVSPTRPARSTNGHFLDSIDRRPYNCVYRAGRVYATHNTMVSNSDDRLTAKWYQMKTNGWPVTSTPSLEMAGQVSGAGVDHFMPAIGVNNDQTLRSAGNYCEANPASTLARRPTKWEHSDFARYLKGRYTHAF